MSGFRQRTDKEPLLLELFLCERQPGNLLITKEACARQHQYGRQRLSKRGRSAFHLTAQKSLEVCGGCPKGRRHFEELSKNLTSFRSDRVSRAIEPSKTTKTKKIER